MTNGTCRGCGKPIVWGTTEDGKKIPLDPRPVCYRIVDDDDPDNVVIERDENVYVTHFATCPNASEFSRRNKK